MPKNNFLQKIKRTLTSVFPISKLRRGKCVNCGRCCSLPNRCPFLRGAAGKTYCSIYKIRPLNCRKYPRVSSEHITRGDCGYRFIKNTDSEK